MKKPYFTQEERLMIKLDTYQGAGLLLDLELQKLKREIYKTYPCLIAKLIIFKIYKIKL